MQVEIFRSFILMKDQGIPLDNWVEKLSNNPVLRTIAGFTLDNMPKTSSYYDFINRAVPLDEHTVTKPIRSKPKAKLKKGEKLPPKNTNVVAGLVNQIIKDEKLFLKRLSSRPERFLQKIFARVSVDQSIGMGLIPESVSVSGDGTCMETGASPYGKKVCRCRENGIYNCTCSRKFSDPNANWGWDSHKERYFYGYTGYFISTYNKSLKIDLPLYLRLVQASRHDSVSAVFALTEFRELSPNLHIDTFISDSASDNYATYELLNDWDINAVIALNGKSRGNCRYPGTLDIDDNGIPICSGGNKMVNWGFNRRDRCRIKWRCPKACGKTVENCSNCSLTKYGRTVYTKPDWDFRLFTTIPRGSDEWKDKMKQRTAAERVNDRILIDYGIEKAPTRGKKRISFFTIIAAINIHLDAQAAFLTERSLFNLDVLLHLKNAA